MPALASTNYPKMWFFMLASAGIDKLPKNVVFLCWPALASTNYPKMWFFMLASAGIDKLPKNVVFMLASAGIDKLPKNVVFYVGQRWHRQITQKCGFLCWPALASTNYPKMWFFFVGQ